MFKLTSLIALSYLLSIAHGRPTEEVEAGGEAKVSPDDLLPKVFKYENGTVGASFMGFKASAGLGAFITGNFSDGWPHAEFETPFGQRGLSGLGPTADKTGNRTGFAFGFLEDAKQSVTPVTPVTVQPLPDADHQSIQHNDHGHDSSSGDHKEPIGNHENHATGNHIPDVSNSEVHTPAAKELEELKSIGGRKSSENEVSDSAKDSPQNKQI